MRKRYLLLAAPPPQTVPAFWMPEGGERYEPWSLTPLHRWNDTSMAKTDLRWVSLAGRDLGKNDFSGADLRHASLGKTLISETSFRNTKCAAFFDGANLLKCDFTGADLAGVSFAGSVLVNCKLPNAGLSNGRFVDSDGKGVTFGDCELDGAVFVGPDLAKASFYGSSLKGANFNRAKLPDAKFGRTALARAIFDSAVAPRADFSDADLTRGNFVKASLEGAKFNRATLTAAALAGATFDENTDFSGASIIGIDLSACDLRKARFSASPKFYDDASKDPTEEKPLTRMQGSQVPVTLIGTTDWTWLNLDGATIVGTIPDDLTGFKAVRTIFPANLDLKGRRLDKANFTYATMIEIILTSAKAAAGENAPDFSHANLRRASMSKVVLPDAKFVSAKMQGINLSNARLSAADFTGARLDSEGTDVANLSYANLANAKFTNAFLGSNTTELSGANLSYVLLYGSSADISGATFPRAKFSGAYLAGMKFQRVDGKAMQSADFTGACLVSCAFNGSDLTNVGLDGACLQGANFTDASLFSAKMNHAAVALAAGTLQIKNLSGIESLGYTATLIATSQTNRATVCPSGANGPCEGAAWSSSKAPMASWTYGNPTVSEG